MHIPLNSGSTQYILGNAVLDQFSTRGDFCPPGDIWQCLKTFLVITTGSGGPSGIWWIATRNAADIPQYTGRPPQHRSIWPQMSTVPQLRTPALQNHRRVCVYAAKNSAKVHPGREGGVHRNTQFKRMQS